MKDGQTGKAQGTARFLQLKVELEGDDAFLRSLGAIAQTPNRPPAGPRPPPPRPAGPPPPAARPGPPPGKGALTHLGTGKRNIEDRRDNSIPIPRQMPNP